MKKRLNFLVKLICFIGVLACIFAVAVKIVNSKNTDIKQVSIEQENVQTEYFEDGSKSGKIEIAEVVDIQKSDETKNSLENNESIGLQNEENVVLQNNDEQNENASENIESLDNQNDNTTTEKINYSEVELSSENCEYTVNEKTATVNINQYEGGIDCVVIPSEIGGKKVENIDTESFSDCYNLETIKISKEIADKIVEIPDFEINESLEEEDYVIYTTTREYGVAYQGYLALSDEEKKEVGIIPPKFENPLEKTYSNEIQNLNPVGSLESAYDLRDYINIKVEDQNPYGICYAYASFTAAETYWSLTKNESIDFSEVHAAILTYGSGGSPFLDTHSYYANKLGPVYEEDYLVYDVKSGVLSNASSIDSCLKADDPSSYSSVQNYAKQKSAEKYVTSTEYFPNVLPAYKQDSSYDLAIENNRNDLKNHIKTYGALAICINSNAIVEYNGKMVANDQSTSEVNHGVSIIGWDDNFSKYNFPSSCRPSEDGAYLVLNSWGNSWGEDGYYWISYEDKWVEYYVVGVTEIKEVSENLQASSMVVTDVETGDVLDNGFIEEGTEIKIDIEVTVEDEISGEEIEVTLRDRTNDYTSFMTVTGTDLVSNKANLEILLDTAEIKGNQYILEIDYGTETISKMLETPLDYDYFVNADGTITITAYLGNEKEIVIPAEYDGYTVKTIGKYAFLLSGVEKVKISEGITTIEKYAFQQSVDLVEIKLPSTLTSIGDAAFFVCSSLKELVIPRSVTSIGAYLIQQCSSLEKIVIFKETTSIGNSIYESTSNPTIYCESGSYALTYAKSVGYIYSIITNSYNITYNKNAGTDTVTNMPSTQSKVQYDTIAISSNIPVRSGYDFLGWATTTSATEAEYVAGDFYSTDANLSLYAVWQSNFKDASYKIEYYQDGVKESEEIVTKQVDGSATTIPVDKSGINITDKYTGYVFEKTVPSTIPSSIAIGGTIKVYYVLEDYNITYNLNGGTLPTGTTNPSTYTIKDSFTLNNPSKIGHIFTGWTGSNGDTPEISVEIPLNSTGDKTYTADYMVNIVNVFVSYVYENGTEAADSKNQAGSYGLTYSVESPVIPGYTPSTAIVTGTFGEEDITETVTYTPNTNTAYKVEHYKQNIENEEYTLFETENKTGTTDTETVATSKGYEGFTVQSITQENIAGDGSTVVKVYYDRNSYTVTYKVDGTQDGEPDTYKYGATIVQRANPTKTGYIFSGWSTIPATMPANNIEIVGTFTLDPTQTRDIVYTIEYYIENVKQEADTETVKVPVHISTDYEFVSFDKTKIDIYKYRGYILDRSVDSLPDEVQEGEIIKLNYILDENQIEPVYYAIKYYKDGELQESDTIYEYKDVHVLAEKTIEIDESKINKTNKYVGYTFEKTEPAEIPEKVDTGTSINVYYTIENYTITYDLNGGSLEEGKTNPTTYTIKDNFTLNNPEKTGYTFAGWTGSNGDTLLMTVEVPLNSTGDKSYKANYEINKYVLTIKYLYEDGRQIAEEHVETLEYGSAYCVTNPIVSGYTPMRDIVMGTMGAKNEDIVVTYAANTNTSYKVEHYKQNLENDDYTLFETETKTGTTDTNTLAESKGYEGFTAKPITQANIEGDESTVVKVYYDRNSYNLTYKLDGEQYEEVEIYKYEQAITPKVNPTRYGYKFSGWSEIPEAMPASNVEIVGTFSIDESQTKDISYTVEYYKDNVKVDGDTQTEKVTVQVLQPDEVEVNKTKINTSDKYFGYKLDTKLTAIPDKVKDGDVIKVYYVLDKENTKTLKYTVEYYKENVKQEDDTETVEQIVQILDSDIITVDKTKIDSNKYYGYKLENLNSIPDTVNSGDVIKLNYIVDQSQVTYVEYQIHYYKDGIRVEEDTLIKATYVQVLQTKTLTVDKSVINTTDKYLGYKLEKTEPSEIPDVVDNGTTINIYYVAENYPITYELNGGSLETGKTNPESYTVNDSFTLNNPIKKGHTFTGWTGSNGNVAQTNVEIALNSTGEKQFTANYSINSYDLTITYVYANGTQAKENYTETLEYGEEYTVTTPVIPGYTASRDVVIGNMEDMDKTITVTYTPNTNTPYKVEYYLQNLAGDDYELRETENKEGTTDETTVSIPKTYEGFSADTIEESKIVAEGTAVVKIYYTRNSYNLVYKVDGIRSGEIETYKYEQSITPREEPTKYGYKFSGWSTIPATMPARNLEITGRFSIDESQTKYLTYTVEYYKEGVLQDADTQTVTNEVQVLQPDTLSVDKSTINTVNKYNGYKLDKTEPNEIPEVISSGETIRVYYVIDESQVKDLSYTVEYYIDNELQTADTQTVTNKVQVLQPDTLNVDKTQINITDKYEDHIFEKSEPTTIPDVVNNGDVIKIYYVFDSLHKKKLNYTVEYYLEDEKQEADTEKITKIVKIEEDDLVTVDKDQINTTDKYYGYKLDIVDTGEIPDETATGSVIKVYYVVDESQTKEISYTVEYYKENILQEVDTQKVSKTVQVLEPDTLSVDKSQINILDKYEGYKFDKTEPEVLPDTIKSGNVIKVYYVENRIEYTVKYYYENVEDSDALETGEGLRGEVVEEFIPKEKYGYKFDRTENIPLTITENPENNIINVYYVRKDAKVNVEYRDFVTGEEISEKVIKSAKVFDTYDISTDVKEIERYTLIESPSELTGEYTEEEQTKVYKYAKNSKVMVNYIDKHTGEVLAEQVIIEGYETKDYETEEKVIENYTFVENTENTTGKMTRDEIIVNYYYAQNTQVTINYIDKLTGETLKTIVKKGKVGDTYKSESKDITDYVLVETPENETVIMAKDEIILNYYYIHVSEGIIEKHIDLVTNEILYNEVHQGKEGDSYKIDAKSIEGYSLVENRLPSNSEGIMKKESITVVYFYLRNASVKVLHMDKVSNQILAEENIEGYETKSYRTREKEFEGYLLVEEPSNSEGNMKVTKDNDGNIVTETTVTYYYKKISAGVIERHYDIKTNELLEEKIHSGLEGDSYKIDSKEFEGYDVVKENIPSNAEGKITVEQIEVKYYYIRKATVKVEYLNVITNEKIVDDMILNRHEGDEYQIDRRRFENYILLEDKLPENEKGTITITKDENDNLITEISVKYYYVRKTTVRVEYINKENNQKIAEDTIIEGQEGEEYKVEAKEINGYKLLEENENIEGTMKKDEIVVKFYYEKIKKEEEKEDDKEQPVTSENYLIKEEKIRKISAETTINDFIENISTESKVTILNNNGEVAAENEIIKTGMKLKFEDGKEYELIVRGDLNCDGKVSLTDLSKLILHYNETKGFILSGSPCGAADMNFDDKVSLTDVSQMLILYNSK